MGEIFGFLGSTFKTVLGIIFWSSVMSFFIGYTFGNYYGLKDVHENRNTVQITSMPGLAMLQIKRPDIYSIIEKESKK